MKIKLSRKYKITILAFMVVLFFGCSSVCSPYQTQAAQLSESGATGIEGEIPSNPPSTAPGISIPRNGQVFTQIPITVSGTCSKDYLVEIFKNNVFAGSAICKNGSYSIQIDLFDGQNDIIARQYDALNQAGPDSGVVTVTFNNTVPNSGTRPTLTTAFAKRGANPGETLSWPLTLSGGTGPYAISVDWGDKGTQELISRSNSGLFNIQHVQQTASTNDGGKTLVKKERVIIWWPMLVLLILVIIAFWLGKRHQLATIRGRLHRGERPI
jgi:hypothetical protein